MSESNKIRVLHLGSPTGLYGAERWILALIRNLPASIESVVAVIKDDPSLDAALCTHAARLGFKTHIFESHGKLSLSAIGQMKRFIQDNRIDVLHTHGYKGDVIGYLATRGTRCRIMSTPHGWSTDAGFKQQAYESLDRFVFRFLDAIVPLSPDLYDGLRKLPLGKRLRYIQNGVDLAEIDAVETLSPELLAWRAQGDVLIGYIGQLIPRKSVDTLIHAFQRLPMSNKRLVIVGEGNEQAALEQLTRELGLADRVHFLGYRQDRISLLKCFDAFALPSRLEGIPRCLLEAMAANVPVVSSDIPGSRDIVRHGQTGYLFEVGDVAALGDRLAAILQDPALKQALAAAGHDLIRSEYSAGAMGRHYAALYADLTSANINDNAPPVDVRVTG